MPPWKTLNLRQNVCLEQHKGSCMTVLVYVDIRLHCRHVALHEETTRESSVIFTYVIQMRKVRRSFLPIQVDVSECFAFLAVEIWDFRAYGRSVRLLLPRQQAIYVIS